MCEIEKLAGLGVIAALAVQDCRRRTLSGRTLMLLLAAAVCFRIYSGEGIISWILCVLPGTLFLIISRITKEGVGYGDGCVILILGIYLGVWSTVEVCMIAVLIMALVSMAGMALWHWKRTKRLPFLPFLAVGYLGMMIW